MANTEVTERDFLVLRLLATTYVMPQSRIKELVYHKQRQTSRRLSALHQAGYLNRNPRKHDPARRPYYFLARKGLEYLSERLERPELLAKPTKLLPRVEHLPHASSVGEFLLSLPQCFAHRDDLQLVHACHEFEPANPFLPELQWTRLYTQITKLPRVVCQPDGAFLVQRGSDQVPYLLEYEMGNTGFKAVSDRKPPGYQGLAKLGRHRVWYPTATTARALVLVVCPTPQYRDRLCSRVKAHYPEEHQYWRYVAIEDTEPEIFLKKSVIRSSRSDHLEMLIAPL